MCNVFYVISQKCPQLPFATEANTVPIVVVLWTSRSTTRNTKARRNCTLSTTRKWNFIAFTSIEFRLSGYLRGDLWQVHSFVFSYLRAVQLIASQAPTGDLVGAPLSFHEAFRSSCIFPHGRGVRWEEASPWEVNTVSPGSGCFGLGTAVPALSARSWGTEASVVCHKSTYLVRGDSKVEGTVRDSSCRF